MLYRQSLFLAGLAVLLGSAVVRAADSPPGPAYQIVLHSRQAEVTPTRSGDSQTGGGSILVEQPEPNTIIVTMEGSAVAGSDFCRSAAGITFDLQQDLEIIPTRTGVRPPRIGMIGRVVGTLQVTDPGICGKPCGTAEQGSATACLAIGGANVLSINVKPSSLSCGQELAINYREGPVEALGAVGSYRLSGTFGIGANQGICVFNRKAAVADFATGPRLDPMWSDVLKPFRAVPRKDFGFKIVLRVVEDAGL